MNTKMKRIKKLAFSNERDWDEIRRVHLLKIRTLYETLAQIQECYKVVAELDTWSLSIVENTIQRKIDELSNQI